ncbi:unnamed protein product [Paramecium sonneborni]|uniref:RING-type E3 ubiquitin transferase n=1 Tax=Paramecium sonneborni TaxID=65129 RepID=A0A8S1REV9_9CILI|nr:unnamed protein product [Paramecium sonneborni]
MNSSIFNRNELKINPQNISNNIVEIFINLKNESIFWDEIALNNSSLQREILNQLGQKLKYQRQFPAYKIEEFYKILDNLEYIKSDYNQIMLDLSKDRSREERYIDCLTNLLMSDPVMLPNSKQIVDRVTIKRLLIKKQEDPFDRSFLSEDMLVEQNELKQEIKQYIESKKQEMRLLRQGQQQ